MLYLSDWCNAWGWHLLGRSIDIHSPADWSSVLGLWAVAGDVSGLTALVAGLASSAEWSTVWRSAVAGNVTELAAGEALQGLGLAVSGEVVALTALVAGGWAWSTLESPAWSKSSLESTAWSESSTASSWWGSAVAGKMSLKAARVAASSGSGEAESWAISLDVSNAGARVALLGLGGAWQWASIGLVSWLLAVVAETLSGGALVGGVADLTTFVAGAAGEGGHFVFRCGIL